MRNPDTEEMDDLFVRHTYLSAVIGMVVQASFGIDIRKLAEVDPADLLQGREFHSATGLQGVLESDFFAWPNEVGGNPLLQTLARRVARFNWAGAAPDTAANLYETIIPAEERRQLGEYYTPAWLARTMVRELVVDPLNQRVLDPACGSGTFLAEAVSHFIAAANEANWDPLEVLNHLRDAVTGIDVHPVAAHLARAAWTLAAHPAISAAAATGYDASMSIPVYLGDALQLRFRTGDMFALNEITIETRDAESTELVFPVSLVERAEDFDALMGDVSAYIEEGGDPLLALDDNHINDSNERAVITGTIKTMQRLHKQGRDHIWAYYTRNMVRPVALSRAKVDVVIGNPPWINYNQTADILRDELVNLSRNRYGIWTGGRYATHQDVASLFFARSVDLYLKDGGVIGFVMPHSALQAGQHSKWRTGKWESPVRGKGRNRTPDFSLSADFTLKAAWDLEQLEPNTFFPIPSCVVFARSTGRSEISAPLAGQAERWRGVAGSDGVLREPVAITDTGVSGDSPYGGYSRQEREPSIFPRCLVLRQRNDQHGQSSGRADGNGKPPTREPGQSALEGPGPGRNHRTDRGGPSTFSTCIWARLLVPLCHPGTPESSAAIKARETVIPTDLDSPGRHPAVGGLERRMRERWQTISALWEGNKEPVPTN